MRKFSELLDNPSSAFSFVSVTNANTNTFPGSGVCEPNDVSMLSAVIQWGGKKIMMQERKERIIGSVSLTRQ